MRIAYEERRPVNSKADPIDKMVLHLQPPPMFSTISTPLISRLDGLELCKLTASSKLWWSDHEVQARWTELLRRDFCVDGANARLYYAYAAAPCSYCRRLFWVARRGSWRRCICVPWRCPGLPLTVVSLSYERCGDGSFCEWHGHSGARAATSALFNVSFRAVSDLSDAAVMDADLVIVHTTRGQVQLSHKEQTSLSKFCEGGGTVLLSCCSVAFLGIEAVSGATVQRSRLSTFYTHAHLCSAGPWGCHETYPAWHAVHTARDFSETAISNSTGYRATPARTEISSSGGRRRSSDRNATNLNRGAALITGDIDFYLTAADDMVARISRSGFANCDETVFDASMPLAIGSAVRVCEPVNSESTQRCHGPLWFPEARNAGQALVCTNLHWLADPEVWKGGLVRQTGNTTLWLNLCGASCRRL